MTSAEFDLFVRTVRSLQPVGGLTHSFYRYPGRFSPEFARGAISLFSPPRSPILDPFMGGGTTAVEALTLGRRFIGADVNPLGVFVTRVKTTLISQAERTKMVSWGHRARGEID